MINEIIDEYILIRNSNKVSSNFRLNLIISIILKIIIKSRRLISLKRVLKINHYNLYKIINKMILELNAIFETYDKIIKSNI